MTELDCSKLVRGEPDVHQKALTARLFVLDLEFIKDPVVRLVIQSLLDRVRWLEEQEEKRQLDCVI